MLELSRQIGALVTVITTILTAAALAQDIPDDLVKNGDFNEIAENGAPADWEWRTSKQGFVEVRKDQDGTNYVAIGMNNPREDSFIQQIVPMTDDIQEVRISTTYRWFDIERGPKGYQEGKVQARFTENRDDFGSWIGLGNLEGTNEDWVTKTRIAKVPQRADGLMLRLAVYGAQSGRLEVKNVNCEPITQADIAARRAEFRPPEPYGPPVTDERFATLARGINVNNWFGQPYNAKVHGKKGGFNSEHFRAYITAEDAERLKTAGFTHIRLPMDPQVFMNTDTGELKPDLLPDLLWGIKLFTDRGVAVIVDAHPKMPTFKAMSRKPELEKNFVIWWEHFARWAHENTDPELVFLELLNEPGGQKYWDKSYPPYQDKLIMAARKGAPNHTLVANPGGWQSVDSMIQHEPHTDRNIIYAAHYYMPSQFTHQGAVWMSDWYMGLHNVPWPCGEDELEAAIAGLPDKPIAKKTAKVLRDMVKQGLGTREQIIGDFEKLANWAEENDRRVIVNEFGVYKPHAPAEDRLEWLNFVTDRCREHDMGWSMWEYAHDFGFATGEPGEREYDQAVLNALGL